MKSLMVLFGIGILSAQTKQSVSDLNWLAGRWEMNKGERTTEEYWLPESGNTMLGIGRTVKNKKITEYEFVVLEQDSSGDIYYRAKPSGQSGASFKLVTLENKRAVFENLSHDFPQRIIYHRISEDSLVARVEGGAGVKARGIVFPYGKKR